MKTTGLQTPYTVPHSLSDSRTSPPQPAGPSSSSSSSAPRALDGARQVRDEVPCSWLKTMARAVCTFASDMENLFLPVDLLASRQPRTVGPAGSTAKDTKSAVLLPPSPLAMHAHQVGLDLGKWLARTPVAEVDDRKALFGDSGAGTQAVRVSLAGLVQGDCGPALRKIVRGCVETAAAAIARSKQAPSANQVQVLLVSAFRSQFAQAAQEGIGSSALWKFMLDVTARVSDWESETETDLTATSHVVPNILVACGLRAVAQGFASGEGPNQSLYGQLARLAPALAGATDPMNDPEVLMFAATQVVHASSDVMTFCARQVVAARVEAHKRPQVPAAGTQVALPGRPSVSRTPSTRIELDTPSMADLRASLAADKDD